MVVAMFLFGREVARRARAEAERDALLASERAARSDAERAIGLKDEFLATLSHELRTPLAAVLGWCAVLRNVLDSRDERDRALETIERNARAQARLIDDLLDVTRLQGGVLHLEFDDVALDVPVRAALQGVQPTADAKSIKIDWHCEARPPIVRGDAGRIQQIAANLLVNAVKFTPSGGTISVTLRSSVKFAELAVADTGEGIDPAFLPHLFTRFRQADSTTTRVHGGLGLGLSIVASLARLHGGDVRADSRGSGHGSTFTVRLPLGADPAVPSAALSAKSVAPGLETLLAGIRVLVVEDEPDVRSALSRVLEQKGASVVALESGTGIEDALASHRPDVLVLDIGMPREDGYTLLRRIRKLPASAGGDVPAISLTAHARDEDRARAFAAGFQRHLPKPIDVPLLVSAIQDIYAAPVRRAVES
jgi:CheY-like chemotaxis protein